MDVRQTYKVEEAAKILGIGRNLCYSKVKTGAIPVIKIGGRLLIPRKALFALLSTGQKIPPAEEQPHR